MEAIKLLFSNIKIYLNYIIIGIIGILIIVCFILHSKLKTAQEDASRYASLSKAYATNLSKSNADKQVFQMTTDMLKVSNDSLIQKITEVSNKAGIKTSKLQQAQYIKKEIVKTDSIVLHDTIFNKRVNIDTVIGNKWVNTRLILKYPDSIKITSKVTLESYTFIYSKRETVNPPKKFFLFRLFQKKHIVLNIKVVENNPYVENKEQRFIEIIK